MKKLRLGIIGCGSITSNSHTDALNYVKDVCDITAACDIIEKRARTFAEKTGAGFYTTDYKHMLPEVDCVLCALPHNLHYECGMFFLKNNKHVLMEKPLCNTEEECLSLVAEAEKRDLTLMCAYPVPYWEGVRKLKELLDSKVYGEVFQMSIWTEQYTDLSTGKWMGDKNLLGGGQLFSHGCHYIDLMLRFLGKPVQGVHVGSKKGTPWMDREGSSNVILTFENGAMGYHFGTWGARGTSHNYDIQVFTDKGFFEYRHAYNTLTYISNQGPVNDTTGKIEWSFVTAGKQTQYEIKHFIDCIINHKTPITDGRSSIESLRVIWRLYEAEENNKIADLHGLCF